MKPLIVLGMAKANLDLKGAKRQKVELDYLRLLYAVSKLRQEGHEARGYLLVMTSSIKDTVAKWQERYQAADEVTVEAAPLTQNELEARRTEAAMNTEGMLAGSAGKEERGRSLAPCAAGLGDYYLHKLIKEREPMVVRSTEVGKFPFQIKWDFYGTQP